MFGIEDALERTILRYVYQNGNCVNTSQLILYIVYKNSFCTEQRLWKRLWSLESFGYLKKFEAYGTTFYELDKDLLSKKDFVKRC